MFWKKKKEEDIFVPYTVLTIYLKNGSTIYSSQELKDMNLTDPYRKFLTWWFCKKSESYFLGGSSLVAVVRKEVTHFKISEEKYKL